MITKLKIFWIKAYYAPILFLLWLLKMFVYVLSFAVPAGLVMLFYWLSGGNFERGFGLSCSILFALAFGLASLVQAIKTPARSSEDTHKTEYL